MEVMRFQADMYKEDNSFIIKRMFACVLLGQLVSNNVELIHHTDLEGNVYTNKCD